MTSTNTIESRLKTYGILLVLIPCLLLIALFFIYALKSTYDNTADHFKQAIKIQETAISRFLLEKSVEVSRIAQSPPVRNSDKQAIAADLQTFYKHNTEYDGLMFIDRNGNSVVSVGTAFIVKNNMADQIYFKKARQGSSSISPFFIDRANGSPTVAFASPVYDTTYEFQGVILGSVKLTAVTSLLEIFHFGGTGVTYLVDDNGTQLTSLKLASSQVDSTTQATPEWLQLQPYDVHTHRALTKTIISPFFWNSEGQLVLATSIPILDGRWQIVGEINVREVVQPLFTLLSSLLILIIIILLASICLSRIMANHIRAPLKELQAAAQGIQQGDYAAALTGKALTGVPAELRELGAAFSQMACTVQDSILQLNETSVAFMEAELKYRNLVENSMVGVYILLDERFSYVNPRYAEIFGYDQSELIGARPEELVVQDDRSIMLSNIEKRLVGEASSVRYEIRGQRKDGSIIWVEYYGTICSFSDGPALMGTMVDISEGKSSAAAIKLSEARYRAVVEDQTDMICRFLPDGSITFANKVLREAAGRSRDQLIGHNLVSLVPRSERSRLKTLLTELTPDNPVQVIEHRVILPNKQLRWLQWINRGLFDENNQLVEFQSVGRDITKRKLLEEDLEYLSLHDQLTGLFNRNYFEQQLVRLSANHGPVGLIIGDLDGLKLINDTQGHATGDKLLKASATVLRQCFDTGQVVARIGGDEFAVLWPGATQSEVAFAYSKLKQLIGTYNEEQGASNKFVLSMSLGYAVGTNDTLSTLDLFKQADHYMYREKLHHNQSKRNATLQALTQALEARDFITQGHAERLQKLVVDMARAIALPEHRVQELELLAQFHDIGKVGIPDNILFKPAALTKEEKITMQRHAEIGYRIAHASPDLVPVADWILKHHEWWDGSGYPLGLKDQDIPLECRILAIADAYDAMTSDRPYRKALSHTKALAELKACAGRQFDPELIEAFCKTFA